MNKQANANVSTSTHMPDHLNGRFSCLRSLHNNKEPGVHFYKPNAFLSISNTHIPTRQKVPVAT